MSGTGDDRDLLAAEYVLGVLEGAERETVRRQADEDAVLGDAITDWENRLSPLRLVVHPVDPPANLWPRIATSCGISPLPSAAPEVTRGAEPERDGIFRRLGFWRASTGLGFGLAAVLAVVLLVRNPPAPPTAVPLASAVLVPPAGGAPAWLAAVEPNQAIQFKPLQHLAVATGKDLELWGLPDGEKVPKPLGLITPEGRTITLPASIHAPMEIMVSLEQKGGSPTGLPQGPVLWQGHMAAYADVGHG
ncbi:MAG TPA: anti-sigma factor [Acidisoma sp.]|jgi:anti-sigma-K factor RskA|nr:anti-sigma factor [Acidisoma sp.]